MPSELLSPVSTDASGWAEGLFFSYMSYFEDATFNVTLPEFQKSPHSIRRPLPESWDPGDPRSVATLTAARSECEDRHECPANPEHKTSQELLSLHIEYYLEVPGFPTLAPPVFDCDPLFSEEVIAEFRKQNLVFPPVLNVSWWGVEANQDLFVITAAGLPHERPAYTLKPEGRRCRRCGTSVSCEACGHRHWYCPTCLLDKPVDWDRAESDFWSYFDLTGWNGEDWSHACQVSRTSAVASRAAIQACIDLGLHFAAWPMSVNLNHATPWQHEKLQRLMAI